MTDREPVSIAFLLANWYSGATLLTLLLDQHPQVVSNGEGFYHRSRKGDTICSCGVSVRACEFYRHAAADMWAAEDYDEDLFCVTPGLFTHQPLRSLFETTRLPGKWRRTVIRLAPGLRRQYDGFVQAHVEFMRRAVRLADASLYLDGTKSLRRAEMFLAEPDFRSRPVLLLVRNPLSWCASWMEKRSRGGRPDLHNATRTWNEYIRRAFLLKKRFPAARFRVLHYEDLCNDPEPELAAVEDWLGLESHPSRDGARQTPHVLGNVMRFHFDGTVRPPTDRSGELSSEQRQEIVRRCGRWMKAVGYTASTDGK